MTSEGASGPGPDNAARPTVRAADAKHAIGAVWGGTTAGMVACRIVDGLAAAHAAGSDPTRAIGICEIARMGGVGDVTEAMAALAILTQSQGAACLRARGDLVEDDGTRVRLSREAFADVVAQRDLAHPVTGEVVGDAASRVVLVFTLVADVVA